MVLILNLFLHLTLISQAQNGGTTLQTNEAIIHSPPKWLKRTRVERITDRIQRRLEWSTRRIHVHWHNSLDSFNQAHSLGPGPAAVTVSRPSEQVIHLGPKVNQENFDQIFAHELVHVIVYQKYRGAIPKWLEEGLANHLSQARKVDYEWLSQQKLPQDVSQVAHPFRGSPEQVTVSYRVSQALIEMLDKKCDLENLIRLSVQRNMADYILTYCEIQDLNQSFRQWLSSQTPSKKNKI
jgi:hypothetical protein